MFARISTLAAVASLASAAQLDAALGTQANLSAATAADIFASGCGVGYTKKECEDKDPDMYEAYGFCYGCS